MTYILWLCWSSAFGTPLSLCDCGDLDAIVCKSDMATTANFVSQLRRQRALRPSAGLLSSDGWPRALRLGGEPAWRAYGRNIMPLYRWQIACLGRAAIAAVLFVVSPAITGVSSSAKAAEITALFPAAMKCVMSELIPQFEKRSGNKVNIEYGTVGAIIARLKRGEAIDVAVVTDKKLPDLTKQGLISAEGQAVVARVSLGVFVRKGEPKTAIRSIEDLKKTLLAAKSIVYGDPKLGDSSGAATEAILGRLGIAAEIRPKAKLVAAGAKGETVAEGDADIGFDQMSNIVVNPKIESLGPLPSALQHYTTYAGGLVAAGKERDGAKAFIAFLISPSAQTVMKSKGFEGL